jgi:hypothetical protein
MTILKSVLVKSVSLKPLIVLLIVLLGQIIHLLSSDSFSLVKRLGLKPNGKIKLEKGNKKITQQLSLKKVVTIIRANKKPASKKVLMHNFYQAKFSSISFTIPAAFNFSKLILLGCC